MKLGGRDGFTLIEMSIVIAIIALILAIAVPNFLRAKINANETAAISSLHTIGIACENYRLDQASPDYPASLATLSSATPPYIDSALGSGTRRGYTFTYTRVSTSQYTCTAAPQTPNVTGSRTFYLDQTGIIRLNNSSGSVVE